MKPKLFLSCLLAAAMSAGGMTACGDEDKGPVRVESIGMTRNLLLEAGDKETLVAHVWPEDAVNKHISWFSTDREVAAYDVKTGEVVALRPGSTRIIASNGDKSAQCTVTVLPFAGDLIPHIPYSSIRELCEDRMEVWDENRNGRLGYDEAAKVTGFEISGTEMTGRFVLAETEWLAPFTGLTSLTFGATGLISIDVLGSKKPEKLSVTGNALLETLDMADCPALSVLTFGDNALSLPDLSDCGALRSPALYFVTAPLLDLSQRPGLTDLTMRYCDIGSLDLSGCAGMFDLICYSNALTSLDISECSRGMWRLNCNNNPGEEGVFTVKTWFDNPPSGTVPGNSPIPYQFTSGWVLDDDRTVTVDYRKVI